MISFEIIKNALVGISDKEGVAAAQRYHKEAIKTYGIKVRLVRALAKDWFVEMKQWDKGRVFRLCAADGFRLCDRKFS